MTDIAISKHDHQEASAIAYQISAMIDVCRFALENESSAMPPDQRGIEKVLEMASSLTGGLIDAIEKFEAASRKTAEEPAS